MEIFWSDENDDKSMYQFVTAMTIWIRIFLSTASNCKIFVLHCNFQYPLPEPSNELADFARVKQQVWFHTPFSLKHRICNFFCTRNIFCKLKSMQVLIEKNIYPFDNAQLETVMWNQGNYVRGMVSRLAWRCSATFRCFKIIFSDGSSLYQILKGNTQQDFSSSHMDSYS